MSLPRDQRGVSRNLKPGYVYMVLDSKEPIWTCFKNGDIILCVTETTCIGINMFFSTRNRLCAQTVSVYQVFEIGNL